MSIAIAVRKNKDIVLATDTQSSFGTCRVEPENHQTMKIRKVGTSYMAATGWGIYDDLLHDFFDRRQVGQLRTRKAIFTLFMKFWKELHRNYSFVNDQCGEKDSPFGDLDASFLLVNSSGIFHVASDMSTTRFDQYFAIGSGADYGLGAVHALFDSSLDAEQLARKAVEAAISFNIYCGGSTKVQKIRAR